MLVQGYDGRALANAVLSNWNSVEFCITNKKINKLLYFCHGFYLARTGRPLVCNHFEAWQHGPVINSLYHEFKEFKYHPITRNAQAFDYALGKKTELKASFSDVQEEKLFYSVIEYFIDYSADDLESMTHAPGTPWDRVYNGKERQTRFLRIPDELIRKHFCETYGERSH